MKNNLIKFCVFVILILSIKSVNASNYIVDNLNDSGPNSLRAAITASNGLSGKDTISIVVIGTIIGTINLDSALPIITSDLVIIGPGPQSLNVHRNATSNFRIFEINYGVSVWMEGITVSNGKIVNGQGGGIRSNGSLLSIRNCHILDNSVNGINNTGQGGGIFSAGAVELNDCTFRGDSAIQTGGTTEDGFGGGIFSQSTITINNCTFYDNFASTSGGGLYHQSGTAQLTNCTFYNNTATSGGGLINAATLTLKSCTITNNKAFGSGGGVRTFYSTTLNSENTIIAANNGPGSSPDFSGTLVSQGNNLIGNTNGVNITGNTSGNILNVNPMLDTLSLNGGPTLTVALLFNSPAINAGNSNSPLTDQRGFLRDISHLNMVLPLITYRLLL